MGQHCMNCPQNIFVLDRVPTVAHVHFDFCVQASGLCCDFTRRVSVKERVRGAPLS